MVGLVTQAIASEVAFTKEYHSLKALNISTPVEVAFPLDNLNSISRQAAISEALDLILKTAPSQPKLYTLNPGGITGIGLTDTTVAAYQQQGAYRAYYQLLTQYAQHVHQIERTEFFTLEDTYRHKKGMKAKQDFSSEDWQSLSHLVKAHLLVKTGQPFPDDTHQILQSFLEAFQAKDIRQVSIQQMPLSALTEIPQLATQNEQPEFLKSDYERLQQEYIFPPMIEYLPSEDSYWVLKVYEQPLSGKEKLAHLLSAVKSGKLSQELALSSISAQDLQSALNSSLKSTQGLVLLGHGRVASEGATFGRVAFSTEAVLQWQQAGEPAILVTEQTRSDDITGMRASAGIVTQYGGMSSHAAVIAKGLGKPCFLGVNISTLSEGEWITLEGSTGRLYQGKPVAFETGQANSIQTVLSWAKPTSLEVWVNAEKESEVAWAEYFGAKGVGLCRTEHLLLQENQLTWFQAWLLSRSPLEKERFLKILMAEQIQDFRLLMQATTSERLTIRLFDPPQHELMPSSSAQMEKLSEVLQLPKETLAKDIRMMQESNPMLGIRGARLGLMKPELYAMQLAAIFQALKSIQPEKSAMTLQILAPFVTFPKEVEQLRLLVDKLAAEYQVEKPTYSFGVMIETPNIALLADEIAPEVDFMSFGTNDLTQTVLALSRDDSHAMIDAYQDKQIIKYDPFVSIESRSVQTMIKQAVQQARSVKPNIRIGVCGEQAADQTSIAFFKTMGIDYLSVPPSQIPITLWHVSQLPSS